MKKSLTKTLRAAVLSLGLLATGAPALAHHAFSPEFDIKKPVTLRGTLTKLEWMNPHSWIHIDVTDPGSGKLTSWAIEFGAPNMLLRRGLRASDFAVGGILEIQGYLARSGGPVANAVSVKLPDGRDFFTSPSPAATQERPQP